MQIYELDKTMNDAFFLFIANAINELTNTKPSPKQFESHCTVFMKSVENIESELSEQISYLSQVTTSKI